MGAILSLFSGIGGLDFGAHLAGYEVACQFDIDQTALDIASKALNTTAFQLDISQTKPGEIVELSQVPMGEDSILIGGPPCTGFSQAGFWIETKRNGEDPQVNRLFDYQNVLEALMPRLFVVENVPGLLFKTHKKLFQSFVTKASALGYSISYKLIDSTKYGLAQTRKRVFIIGIKGRRKFDFPEPPYSNVPARDSFWALTGIAKSNNVVEENEKLTGKYADILPDVPPGDNYSFFTAKRGHPNPRFEWRSRYSSFLQKLDPHKPSPTVAATKVTNNGPFHWENRHLRKRELARLQSFPDKYPLPMNHLEARRHIGNAVPPIVSAEIFWQIRVFMGEANEQDRPDYLRKFFQEEYTAKYISTLMGKELPA